MRTPSSFSVIRRNYGHWDICAKGERAFRIRGGPGDWWVADERRDGRPFPRPHMKFREQNAAMAWICAELMHELLIAEGQTPHVIEGWNVEPAALSDAPPQEEP